jgi:hypothetical protein
MKMITPGARVDHAFVSAPAPGTNSVGAGFVHGTVIIVVTDDGTWRPPDDDPGHRGRGLALIHAPSQRRPG